MKTLSDDVLRTLAHPARAYHRQEFARYADGVTRWVYRVRQARLTAQHASQLSRAERNRLARYKHQTTGVVNARIVVFPARTRAEVIACGPWRGPGTVFNVLDMPAPAWKPH